jgi:hemoglobin
VAGLAPPPVFEPRSGITPHQSSFTISLPDLQGRSEIGQFVNAFHQRVQQDDLLGFIFEEVAKTNRETHLPRLVAFWETVIFRRGGFVGNPLAAHAKLVALTEMGRPQFDRWLLLFRQTVDVLFAGEHAGHLKSAAAEMVNVIYSRINHVVDPRFDPANPTPGPRARQAACRESGAASA